MDSSIINTDIISDTVGIPYIPAKRIKGVLRDSTREVLTMMNMSKLPLTGKLTQIYGDPHSLDDTFQISNAYIKNYHKNKKILQYFVDNNDILAEEISDIFTSIRHFTALENGVPKDKSLRSVRVLNRGIKFRSSVFFDAKNELLLALSVQNLRYIGMKTTRGFGYIKATLFDAKENDVSSVAYKRLEELIKHVRD